MNYRGPRRRTEREVHEKIFEEITVKNYLNMGKEIGNQVQRAQRVIVLEADLQLGEQQTNKQTNKQKIGLLIQR